jgi:sigma-B regulation protein RsbU (phosphoserine phosphatase)
MKANRGSVLNRALAKWLPDSRTVWIPGWIKYVAALIGFSLAVLIAASVILRLQVRARTAEISRKNIELREEIAERKAAQQKRDQLIALEQELRVGRSIQQFILHHDFPPFPDRRDFDVYAEMLPAKDVGGDFYDFFLVDEHHLGIAIGDVSGKGVPAAILMSASRTMLRAAALQAMPPDECLRYVNSLLCETTPPHMFVSAIYAVLDTRSGELVLSHAGHPWPCLLDPARGPSELRGEPGIALGLVPDATYALSRGRLNPGSAVFLYSDGVTEALDDKDEFFGDERLCSSLSAAVGKSPRDVLMTVRSEIQAFTSGAAQSDDITMAALAYYGPDGRPA